MEADLEGVVGAVLAGDGAGLQIEPAGDGRALLLVDGVVAAFSQHIQRHVDAGRIVEQGAVRPHHAAAGQGVPQDDRDDLRLDEHGDLLEPRGRGVLVRIEAPHQLLPGVPGHVGHDRDVVDDVVGPVRELERALVLELGVDARLDRGQRRIRVDEVVDHLAIADELAAVLQRAHLRRLQQGSLTIPIGAAGQAPLAPDQRRVPSPLPTTGAPPSHMISSGNPRVSTPRSWTRLFPHLAEGSAARP